MATLVDRKPDVLLSPIEQSATLAADRPKLHLYEQGHTPWASGLSTFAPFMLPLDDTLYFMGYKAREVPTVGAVSADRRSITLPPLRVYWELGTDWTCLLPVTLASQSFVLAYDRATGDIKVGSIAKDGEQVNIDEVPVNLSQVAAEATTFVLNNQSSAYLLVYAGTTLSAWQITSDQSGITLTSLPPLTDFGEGWTNFIALPFAYQRDLYFLAYNSNSVTGEVAAVRIALDTNTLQSWPVTPTSSFLTGLMFFATDFQDWSADTQGLWLIGCKPISLTTGSSTVMAGLVTLTPQDAGIKIDKDWYVEDWQLQPSCVMSFMLHTESFFLAYQAISGMGEQEGMIYIDAGPRPGIGDGEPPDPIVDAPATDKSIRR